MLIILINQENYYFVNLFQRKEVDNSYIFTNLFHKSFMGSIVGRSLCCSHHSRSENPEFVDVQDV